MHKMCVGVNGMNVLLEYKGNNYGYYAFVPS